MSQPTRRVVCTGIGLVSPLAIGAQESWHALINSRSGIQELRAEHSFDGCKSRVAAYVDDKDVASLINQPQHKYLVKHAKQLSRATNLAMLAAHEALQDAKLLDDNGQLQEALRLDTGVAIGQGMVDFQEIFDNGSQVLDEAKQPNGYRKVSPFFMTRALMNMSAGNISIRYKIHGPNHCVSTACATGAHSIGDAFRFIKHGQVNRMICGSTEASINSIALAGFERLKALCYRFNEAPERSSRPFDTNRGGFVMGEGAGVLVLEELEHAKTRGISADKIYGELLGYGASSDAHHLTAPLPDGKGAKLSMAAALKDAGLEPSSISYVNAHATSTPLGDDIEANAIEDLFCQLENSSGGQCFHVSSNKGSIGHLLGAAGSVETVIALLSCYNSLIPHTLNLRYPLNTSRNLLNMVAFQPVAWNRERRVLMKNSFGFGGTNASLVVANYL